MKFLPVIILYRQNLTACSSYLSLLKEHDGAVFVFDNSPAAQKMPDDPRFIYRHAPDNPGISYGYNRAAEYAREHGYPWLLLLDQDTTFNYSVSAYEAAVRRFPGIKLFAPSLVTQKQIPLSPVNSRTLFPTAARLPEQICSLNDYVPVNSGVFIETDAFFACGMYNEKVFLDHSDYDFMERARKVIGNFVLLPELAEQDFSGDEPSPEQQFARLILFLKSARHCRWLSLSKKLKMNFFVFCYVLRTGKKINMPGKALCAWLKIFVFNGETP